MLAAALVVLLGAQGLPTRTDGPLQASIAALLQALPGAWANGNLTTETAVAIAAVVANSTTAAPSRPAARAPSHGPSPTPALAASSGAPVCADVSRTTVAGYPDCANLGWACTTYDFVRTQCPITCVAAGSLSACAEACVDTIGPTRIRLNGAFANCTAFDETL